MKFAFVSHVLPPSWSGQAVVIYRLLKGLNPEDYCLVSQGDCDADASRDEYTQRLSAHHYQLPPTFESRRGFVNIPFNIFARARHILHRWAGVGGTLGFTDLSRRALALQPLLDRPQPLVLDQLRDGIDEIARLMAGASPTFWPRRA